MPRRATISFHAADDAAFSRRHTLTPRFRHAEIDIYLNAMARTRAYAMRHAQRSARRLNAVTAPYYASARFRTWRCAYAARCAPSGI